MSEDKHSIIANFFRACGLVVLPVLGSLLGAFNFFLIFSTKKIYKYSPKT